MLAQGVDFILYAILDGVVDNYAVVAESYELRLEQLEEASLQTDADGGFLADAARLRHELLDLRRLAFSLRELVMPLADGECDYISGTLALRFRHVCDHLTQVIELTDVQRERLHGVRDNYHMTLTARTNIIMRTLTLFASIMLPLSFVAGVYGMNLPLWPPPHSPWTFWGVLGVMAGIATILLLWFRQRKWL